MVIYAYEFSSFINRPNVRLALSKSCHMNFYHHIMQIRYINAPKFATKSVGLRDDAGIANIGQTNKT